MVDSPLPARLVVKRPIVESFNRASHFQGKLKKRIITNNIVINE